PVLRQIARYLPHHRSKNASKTHPKSSHDKFKTASERLHRTSHSSPLKILRCKDCSPTLYRTAVLFQWDSSPDSVGLFTQ
ncbi:hypothetical protein, partial [Bacteroides gallinaceum]|uniref:hypothetical protein n=1 Tax=Bacteroides gallinaceum TaxID=1462571 RepID=UPI0019578EA3